MDKPSKEKAKDGKEICKEPKSLSIASNGVKTSADFAKLMSALMTDLIQGNITPNVGNATCNAGGKLLKVVEMTYKYGTENPASNQRTLSLTLEETK